MVERWCAPVLLLLSFALLVWAHQATAGGFGTMLSTPSQFGPGMPQAGQFWRAFFPALTANVGYWATLSLNIPDFTRHAREALGSTLQLAAWVADPKNMYQLLALRLQPYDLWAAAVRSWFASASS